MIRAFDIDGVLADFNSAYRVLIIERFGIELPPISDTFPEVWRWDKAAGLTNKQNNILWEHIKESNFWANLEPTPQGGEALAHLWDLRYAGDHIYFITSRPGGEAKWQTECWLEDHGYGGATVLMSSDKGSVCKGLGVEMFVDDKPENCLEVALDCPKAQVYLLDAPYNRGFNNQLFKRVSSILDPRIMGVLQDVG